jgi:AsmA protein
MLRLAIGALVAVLLAVAGLAALPYLVPEHEFRAAVMRSLQSATGITPRIGSLARLSMLPRPAIRLNDVRLDDGERTGFSAGSLHATVRFLPLLAGKVEIGSFTFEHPRLAIELHGDRASVIGLPLRPPTREQATGMPEIRIVDGTLELHLEGSERIETLSAVEGSLAWSGTSLTATGSFLWRNVSTTASLSIADTAALGSGARSPSRLRIEGEAFRFGFDGGIALRNGLQAEGVLAFDARSLKQVFALFSIEPPTHGGFGPFSLKAHAALNPAGLSLSGAVIELDGNRSEGGLTLKREGGRSGLQGTLASELADFTRYLRNEPTTGHAGREILREPISGKMLDALDLDLRLSARKALIGKATFERVALAVQLKSGRLALSIGEARVFGGTLRGNASLAPSANGGELKLDANLNAFEVERALNEITGLRALDGTGMIALTLAGSGTNLRAILHELNGQASMMVERGSLNGINVGEVLRRLERRPLAGIFDLRGGRTAFDRLAAKVRFAQGMLSLEEAQIDSAQIRITLTGAASIARRDLDLHGMASLTRSGAAGGANAFDLPFLVLGSWDNPSVIPDPEALILRSGAAAPLLDNTRGQKAREAVRSIIDSIARTRSGSGALQPPALPPVPMEPARPVQ